MPTVDVWTKAGIVSMSVQEAEAYRQREDQRRARARTDMIGRALKAAALIAGGQAALILVVTPSTALASGYWEAVLNLISSAATAACAVATWRLSSRVSPAVGGQV